MASKKESEHYLDQLLYSVNGTGDEKTIEEFFLKELEYELESDEYQEYLSDFEMELEEEEHGLPPVISAPNEAGVIGQFNDSVPDDEEILKEPELLPDDEDTEAEHLKQLLVEPPEEQVPEPDKQEVSEKPLPKEPEITAAANTEDAADTLETLENDSFSMDAMLDKVTNIVTDIVSDAKEVMQLEEELPLDEPSPEGLQLEEPPLEELHLEEVPLEAEEIPLTDDLDEPDLSGNGADDLLELLAGEKGLEDIGALLSEDGPIEPDDGMDEIQEFAKNEMQEQERAVSGEKEKDSRRKLKFMDKLKNLLFGDDDENEDDLISLSGKESTASELSAENQQILKELEEAEGGAKATKGKKEKKKKEKKAKPKKEKVKKEKKPKPKKPPKEKKPKEKDNTPPLPKKPVILILFMVGSLTVLVLLGTSFAGYSTDISEAQKEFSQGDYLAAYQHIAGYDIKEKDEKLYYQTTILASVYSKYEGYLVFKENDYPRLALDCLICAAGRYDLNMDKAEKYECTNQLNELGFAIEEALMQNYGITWEQALEIYNQRNRTLYTIRLYEVMRELGLE